MISTLSHQVLSDQELLQLDQNGFVVFKPKSIDCSQLKNVAKKLYSEKYFKSATISEAHLRTNTISEAYLRTDGPTDFEIVRNDFTLWLDPEDFPKSLTADESMHLKNYCAFLGSVLSDLRTYFRMSLHTYETHFAVYPSGHFYQKHVDQTVKNNKRFFSFVIYLNENWTATDGGQLVGYKDQRHYFDCLPHLGTMILFLSSLEHEVLPSHRDRYSITGWFRND